MASKPKRAALYLRVSTDGQTVDNQRLALEAVCEQRGWEVVEVYADNGVSGAKGRNQRPGLDALLKDASRGRFNVVLAWALDRLGRSLMDLLVRSVSWTQSASLWFCTSKPSTQPRLRAGCSFRSPARSQSLSGE